jgi:transcription-repair coupling factor (superfamily II helicase)
VDVEDDVFIPQDYVTNPVERLNLYRRLADLDNADEIDAFRAELEDRFGAAPHEIDTLLRLAAMRPLAMRLRFPRATWKNQRLFLSIPEPSDDPYFHQKLFNPLLEALNGLDRRYVLKDSRRTGKLRAIIQDVTTLKDAQDVLAHLADAAEPEVETEEAETA